MNIVTVFSFEDELEKIAERGKYRAKAARKVARLAMGDAVAPKKFPTGKALGGAAALAALSAGAYGIHRHLKKKKEGP